jgi:hypothetical protein
VPIARDISGSETAGTGGSGGGGSGTSGSAGVDAGSSSRYAVTDGVQARSDKLDLLFVVDNSISMADKQTLLTASLPHLLERLTNPLCIDAEGQAAATQPVNGTMPCPQGASRARAPVLDMHVGVITSSLGAFGGEECAGDPSKNDRAHLVPTLRGDGPATFQDKGFMKWGPDAGAVSELGELTAAVQQMVTLAGESGCGYEATLEAAYRFLVDPQPYETIVRSAGEGVPSGTDAELLAQRAAFLRPDSAVQVVILSDENDCSASVEMGWLVSLRSTYLPRATSQCDSDPNDACCRSCGQTAEPGCPSSNEDPNCVQVHDSTSDSPNLRCFDQKRRFGVDLLYPTPRYAVGFTDRVICPGSNRDDADCQCRLAEFTGDEPCEAGPSQPNPLFASGRHPSLVSVAALVGVPWQYLASDLEDPTSYDTLSVARLNELGRWPVIAGSPTLGIAPSDPFMQESIAPRSGTSSITGDSILPPATASTNDVNGHEYNVLARNDLQYACITELPMPRECSNVEAGRGCDCDPDEQPELALNPVCRTESGAYGTLQTRAKAYPGLRHLELMAYLDARGIPASICSPNTSDPNQPNYGHHPAIRAMLRRLDVMLK